MTIVEFIKAAGCKCFERTDGPSFALPSGGRVYLHPGISCHTTTTLVRGSGSRPRVARHRRRWLRARRRAMRRTGRPPENASITYVSCRGCEATAETTDHLEGAL